ncbi:MAG: FtsX-like permease family protein, partial [Bacilli bacterium]|nr:FtsX-like permease family protein [Bacilli bacterium]MDD4282811.1 FtsX-like permease family protein [Bacilli bacterium]
MKLLYDFAIKNLKENKKRTMVSIIGITLSCSLLFSIGFFASTYRDNAIREVIRYNGSHHIEFNNINTSKVDIIKKDLEVKDVVLKIITNYGTIKFGEYDSSIEVVALNLDYNNIFSKIIGRLPEKGNEVIISHSVSSSNNISIDNEIKVSNNKGDTNYKVVGIYFTDNRSAHAIYSKNRYTNETFFNYFETNKNSETNVFVTLKSTKHAHAKLANLAAKLELPFPDIDSTDSNQFMTINTGLLFLYGEITNKGTNAVISLTIMLISFVLSVICILIIYNAFTISVTERKRQFGMLSSVGASPMQIIKLVFIEVGIISIIAVPLGFIISILNVSFTLLILNKILEIVIVEPLRLSLFPFFILISLTFVLFSIFISALLPAARASDITPIEAIKLNKDIKIKRKRIKSNKLISKLFGIEGELALKNIKRNKKRYRTTTISIVISIVLFILISIYLNAISTSYIWNNDNADVSISIPEGDNQKNIIIEIKKIGEIKDIIEYKQQSQFIEPPQANFLYKDYLEVINEYSFPNHYISVILLEEEYYQKYMKKLGLKSYQPIILNYGEHPFHDEFFIDHSTYKGQFYNDDSRVYFNFCNFKDIDYKKISNCYYKMNNFLFVKEIPLIGKHYQDIIIVNKEVFHYLAEKKDNGNFSDNINDINMQITIKNPKIFDEEIKKIIEKHPNTFISYYNSKLDNQQNDLARLALKFALYSFSAFITLIAVTNVINSINTSINLRKTDFAILRSVGQTPKSFNKMIRLESIFLGLKSLFYGFLTSFGLIYTLIKINSLSYG